MMDLRKYIRDIPNFPKEGIIFRDITPLWRDAAAYAYAIELLWEHNKDSPPDVIVSPEARGYIMGAPLAYKLGCGFVPVRKRGKLPWRTITQSYILEYGEDEIQIHEDAIQPHNKVLIVDDLLATGGTAKALTQLVEKAQGNVLSLCFLVELTYLSGRSNLAGYDVYSIIKI